MSRHLGTAICVALALAALTARHAAAQEAARDPAARDTAREEAAAASERADAAARDPVGGDAEECFDITRSLDMDVLDDRHVYVRTFGGNHYLMTMQSSCRNLHRSHLAGGVRINPYGRRVCANDGSHIVYSFFGRESVCRIMRIDTVDGRAQAMAIVEEGSVEVEMTEISPPE